MPSKPTKKPKTYSEDTHWRVTLVVGFKTYGKGKTEEDAINDVYERILNNPPIEEYVYKSQLIKGKAEKPMEYSDVITDPKW
jgi:hypothetical protein